MKRKLICGILLLFCVFHQLASQVSPRIVTSISPGTSCEPLIVRFSFPFSTRLSLRVNDGSEIDYSEPLFLTTEENTEKTFFVTALLYPLDPNEELLEKKLFYWKIDRKPPSPPRFFIREAEGGSTVSMLIDEPGTIEYRMFHTVSGAFGSGTVLSNERLFLPLGSSLVAWGIDSSGNVGPSSSPTPSDLGVNGNPFTVVNPVSGTWSNKQTLLIESAPGIQVYYSVNESDTERFGQLYTGPVVLENEGVVDLRIWALDSENNECTTQILYTVKPKLYPAFTSIDTSVSFLELGEFAEFRIPSGYLFELGGINPYFTGDTSVVFSGIRGVNRYYPLTISDSISSWRWICSLGFKPSFENSLEQINTDVHTAKVLPKIHDWNYISFEPSYIVFYSLDKINWKQYVEPIFVSRTENSQLYWYSASVKKGEVQILSLPSRPKLTGVPLPAITSNSVFLGVTKSPYTFYIETGSLYYPQKPSVQSSLLSNGLLFEVPSQAISHFKIRVLAVHEGIVHGELYESFTIDRKPPRVPVAGLKNDIAFSRKEVRFSPRGEDDLVVTINPPLFKIEKDEYILTGDTNRPVDYEINLFSQDAAGNKSDVLHFSIRIDLNAVFVDSHANNSFVADGTPRAPFIELDSALDLIEGPGKWRIYIQGSPEIQKKHTFNSHVSFFGTGGQILFGPDASLSFFSSSVSMENLVIIQQSNFSIPQFLYPVTKDMFSLIQFNNCVFNAINIELKRINQFSGALISAIQTNINCQNSVFLLQAIEYAQVFYIDKSSLTASSCTFSASARDVSALAVTNSTVYIKDSDFSIEVENSGRAIEAWNSMIDLTSVSLTGLGKKTSLPVAVWLDQKSSLVTQNNSHFSGFDFFTQKKIYNK